MPGQTPSPWFCFGFVLLRRGVRSKQLDSASSGCHLGHAISPSALASVPRLTGGHPLEKPCVLCSEPGLESGVPDVQSDAFHKTSLPRGRAVDGCVSEDLEFGYFRECAPECSSHLLCIGALVQGMS